MKVFQKYCGWLGFLDSRVHKLHDKHLVPRKLERWICDAFDYNISGGLSGQQNWPLNLHKLNPWECWDFENPIKRSKNGD